LAKGSALKMNLPSVDDLFSTEEERQEAKLKKLYDIPLSEIDDFPDHPYRVLDDEDMQALMDSISERGVITPAMVRQKENGRYEVISGHRRKRACEKLGLETLRCEVVDVTRDEAIILMVDSVRP
jgi:ParB family chromosome partitioning protein